MTAFDYIAGAILLVSGLIGFARGATREVMGVIAFLVAAIMAIFALRITGPIALHWVHTVWLADTLAVVVLFLVVYMLLRMVGGVLTRGVRTAGLSGLDRILGFAIGLVRALVIIGAFSLLVGAAIPPNRTPRWIASARLYPLARAAGDVLRTFAPRGLRAAQGLQPGMNDASANDTQSEEDNPDRAPTRGKGYTARQRKAMDDLVEQSR